MEEPTTQTQALLVLRAWVAQAAGVRLRVALAERAERERRVYGSPGRTVRRLEGVEQALRALYG
jgi:hypothetical protein